MAAPDLIPPSDLRVSAVRRPPGGQHVGGAERGVTVEHIPTGIVVTVDVGRSQHINRMIAAEMIEAALTSGHLR